MTVQTDFSMQAELMKLDFQRMFVAYGQSTEPRIGLHASSLLVPDDKWCTRKHVLVNLFPEEAVQPELHPWDWKQQEIFLHGWEIHRMLQHIFKHHAQVVNTPVHWNGMVIEQEHRKEDYQHTKPELDLTHYDAVRNLYFSPDAIIDWAGQHYVVEIKGVNQAAFSSLADDLEQACSAYETVNTARKQANLYMKLLDLKRGLLLVWNKNQPDFKLWITEPDAQMYEPQKIRMYEVKGNTTMVRSQGLSKLKPRVCASINDPLAKKCPMRLKCFSENVEEK